ncbi:MAG: SpoIIE family protein phosphatase [Gemmataceae bacterium]|nr:SpoIIE family protein phosphatase [Gemmataceae bacterium]
MAHLRILSGPKKGQKLPLRGERITIGREAQRDLCLGHAFFDTGSNEGVSRWHAVITRSGDEFSIVDGDGKGRPSHNKTLVNGREVPATGRTPLLNGDRIAICGFKCEFHGDSDDTSSSIEVAFRHDSSVNALQAQPAEKLRALLEISLGLGAVLDMAEVGPRLLDHLFGVFKQADRGFIVLADEPGGPASLRTLRTRRPGDADDARYSSSIVRRCMEGAEAILGDDLPRQFPDSASVGELGVRSLMCAPLGEPGSRPLGAIQIDTRSRVAKFAEDDLRLLQGVASLASVALTNARLHRRLLAHQARERDLALAREVQAGLLPAAVPEVPGYAFHAHYASAQQVGGDYYGFFPLPQGRLAVLLGDVAGKGVAAALIMARLSVEARVCLEACPDLASAITRLNAVISQARLADRFVTLAALVLDPAAHTLAVVNAGHPPPLVCRHATGAVEEVAPRSASGSALGVNGGYEYQALEARLEPGDTVVMYSDGLPDAQDAKGRAFKKKGILAVLEGNRLGPRAAAERLLEAVEKHSAGCEQFDDIALVSFGRTA